MLKNESEKMIKLLLQAKAKFINNFVSMIPASSVKLS